MHHLYKITNTINNKVYIGQSVSFKRRWTVHKSVATTEHPVQFINIAMKNEGVNNFVVEWICCSKTKDDANHTETRIISQYKSNQEEFGYNKSPGGDGMSDERKQAMSKFFSETDDDNLIKMYSNVNYTMNEISEHFKCSKELLYRRLNKLNISKIRQNQHWKSDDPDHIDSNKRIFSDKDLVIMSGLYNSTNSLTKVAKFFKTDKRIIKRELQINDDMIASNVSNIICKPNSRSFLSGSTPANKGCKRIVDEFGKISYIKKDSK